MIAKRDELHKLRKTLEGEIQKITCDIDHPGGAIARFDPEQTPRAVTRYVTKHRAKKGSVTPFVLKFLREAKAPVTSREITMAWLKARNLRADDATYVIIRKRIGACLMKLRVAGLVVGDVTIGEYKEWIVAFTA